MYEQIRKVTIGSDMKDGMHYVVGSKHRVPGAAFTLTSIVYDERHWIKYGTLKVDLYITMAAGEERIWKSFQDMPIAFEYNLKSVTTNELA
jgi:hypothetical protein